MKVFAQGFPLQGKIPFEDKRADALAAKFNSAETVYYSVEFIQDHPAKAECFVIPSSAKLDYIVEDIEKLERAQYTALDKKELIQRALAVLEKEMFLFQEAFAPDDVLFLRNLNLFTIKPGMMLDTYTDDPQAQYELLKELLRLSGRIFFYTAGKKDSHVWDVYAGTPIVEAAGRIHTDLKRGFIRAEIYNVKDIDKFGSFQEAKGKGLVKTVEKTYIVEDGDVLDIKFSV